MNKEINDKVIRVADLRGCLMVIANWPLPPFSYDKIKRSLEEELKSIMVELAEFGISD